MQRIGRVSLPVFRAALPRTPTNRAAPIFTQCLKHLDVHDDSFDYRTPQWFHSTRFVVFQRRKQP